MMEFESKMRDMDKEAKMKENQLKIQIDQDQKILDLCKSKINDLRQKIKTYRQIIEENSKIKEKKTEDFQGEERKERIRYHKEENSNNYKPPQSTSTKSPISILKYLYSSETIFQLRSINNLCQLTIDHTKSALSSLSLPSSLLARPFVFNPSFQYASLFDEISDFLIESDTQSQLCRSISQSLSVVLQNLISFNQSLLPVSKSPNSQKVY